MINIIDTFNMKTPCGGVIVFRKKNDIYECLIVEEHDNKNINHLYAIGFPKGKREKTKNETTFECAKRELYEETKIDISQLNFTELHIIKEYANNKIAIIYLIAILKEDFYDIDIEFDKNEIKCASFIKYEDAKNILRLKCRKDMLNKAHTIINNKNTVYISGIELTKKYQDYILEKNISKLKI